MYIKVFTWCNCAFTDSDFKCLFVFFFTPLYLIWIWITYNKHTVTKCVHTYFGYAMFVSLHCMPEHFFKTSRLQYKGQRTSENINDCSEKRQIWGFKRCLVYIKVQKRSYSQPFWGADHQMLVWKWNQRRWFRKWDEDRFPSRQHDQMVKFLQTVENQLSPGIDWDFLPTSTLFSRINNSRNVCMCGRLRKEFNTH